MGKRGPQPVPPAERFAKKIAPGENGCIEWQAGTNGVGYGLFHPNTTTTNQKVYAHRWAYEQKCGPIPAGLHLDHLCRNTICVNPDHLEPVTPRVNLLRGVGASAKNARKDTCLRGHPLYGDNLYVNPSSGYRQCRACARLRSELGKEEQKEKARAKRAAAGARSRWNQTDCLRGHPLSGDNLYIAPGSGRRCCRACRRMHDQKSRKKD